MKAIKKSEKIQGSLGLLTVLLLTLINLPSFGQLTLLPTDDTYVRGGGNSANNFGTDTILFVKNAAGDGFTRRSFLKFDLSAFLGTVSSAQLKLEVAREGTDTYSALLVPDDSWSETTLTWDTQPAVGDVIATSPGGGVGAVLSFDLTAAVIEQLTGDKTLSISLVSSGTSNLNFYSKEKVGKAPVLELTGPPPGSTGPDFSSLMGSCDFNGGLANVNAFDAAEALQAVGIQYTRIGIVPDLYLQGSTVRPESIDSVVLLLYNEGIVPMLLVEHNPENGALGPGSKWFDIGAAFAARFRPNSPWLLSNGISGWGITQYSAINEPLINGSQNPDFPVNDYLAATQGFADGVHSVDPALEVAPGGFQEVPLFTQNNIYMDGLAPLFNDGILDALDIHRYYDRRNPYNLQFKRRSHQALIDSLEAWYNITADFRVWSTEYNARGTGSDEENAKDFVTATWDLLTVKGNNGDFVSDFALTFRTYLPVSSNVNLGMAISSFPFVGNPKGTAHQMLANITQGFRLVSGDESAGVDILEGDEKKMWVWHNRAQWSNQFGTSFSINNIPSFAKTLEVYQYDSWNAVEGSTGTPAPARTLNIDGLSSVVVDQLDTGQTYMFIAKVDNTFNEMPNVTITGPSASDTFVEGDTLTVSATAADADGIAEVVLYAGPTRLGKVTAPPYALTWPNAPAGTTTLLAIAKDTKGAVRLAKTSVSVDHPNNGVNLLAAADTYVKGGQTDDDNFGSDPGLLIKTAANDNLKRRIFLKFNLDTLGTVEQATLRLRVARTGNANHSVYYVQDDNWTESGITWNNQPPFTTEITSSSVAPEGQWTDFDVTSQVISEQSGDGVLSLVIWTSSTALVEYFSKESPPGNEPRLLVTSAGVQSPEIKFIFPKNEFEYPVNWPALALVKATSRDSASVTQVEFFIGDSLVKTDTQWPYFLRTNSLPSGPFTLTAVATDSEGKQSSETLNLATSFGGISLDPVDDTYIRGGNNSSTNYGLSDVLKVKASGAAFTRRAFLKFDLSGVKRRVNSAILRLKVKREGTDDYRALFVADDSWDEETLTWDTEPLTGEVVDSVQGAPLEEWINFDITAIVARELSGDKVLSLSLVSSGTSNLELYSKEGGFGNTPELLINPRNDPATAKLSAVALDEDSNDESATNAFIIQPNPVDLETTIAYVLDKSSPVEVVVTDVAGSIVAHHTLDPMSAGKHTLSWDRITQGQQLHNGIYLVRLVHNAGYFSQRVMVTE